MYVRQTVEYAVEEAERIKSLLLLPKSTSGTAPAVIAHHQHAGQFDLGKSEVVGLAGDADQAYGVELAERGYVVIAPDALAFEERNWSAIAGQAEYYELASRLVRGQTLLGKVLHDVRVALDYLIPFAVQTQHWTYEDITGFDGDSLKTPLLRAAIHFHGPEYLGASDRLKGKDTVETMILRTQLKPQTSLGE